MLKKVLHIINNWLAKILVMNTLVTEEKIHQFTMSFLKDIAFSATEQRITEH